MSPKPRSSSRGQEVIPVHWRTIASWLAGWTIEQLRRMEGRMWECVKTSYEHDWRTTDWLAGFSFTTWLLLSTQWDVRLCRSESPTSPPLPSSSLTSTSPSPSSILWSQYPFLFYFFLPAVIITLLPFPPSSLLLAHRHAYILRYVFPCRM